MGELGRRDLGMTSGSDRDREGLRPSDTSPEAERILIELYRRMPAWQKLRQVFQLTRVVQELALCDIRRHPGADEREQHLQLASRWLDAETMRRVFSWDPDR